MAEVEVTAARPIRVGNIDAPWHVTTECFRPADAESDSPYHNRDRLRLYRGETEVYAVEYQFLSEVDGAKAKLLSAVAIYEGERIRALAFLEALREAGVEPEATS